jgi:hypothetical protein
MPEVAPVWTCCESKNRLKRSTGDASSQDPPGDFNYGGAVDEIANRLHYWRFRRHWHDRCFAARIKSFRTPTII